MPPIDNLVKTVVRGRGELLEITDPLEAEQWASQMLGAFYKMPIPFDARLEFDAKIGPAIVAAAVSEADPGALAMLRAIAAVADAPLEAAAQRAADGLAGSGLPEPVWGARIGRPELLEAWTATDVYGDQTGYYSLFRYPARPAHLVMALYDEALGGIVKDAVVATPEPGADLRVLGAPDPGIVVADADESVMAARVLAAIATGDLFVDNDWTKDFKSFRLLVQARMRTLPAAELPEPAEPMGEEERRALIGDFKLSAHAPETWDETTESIVHHCLDARCDYGDGDPLRWSPVVVEMFLMDFLPRKATLDLAEIRAAPDVLKRWVRFALHRRGLDERWIVEAEQTVDRYAAPFQKAATDPSSFGPGKAISQALLADGVDITDQAAVDRWLAAFNARPLAERDAFFGPPPI